MKKVLLIFIGILVFIPSMLGQDSTAKRVAILEIIDKDNFMAYGIKLMLRSKLASAITNTHGYEAYDRVDIASIMNEQDFQHSGLVDEDQIRRLGEMAGVDFILVSEIMQFDERQILITAKIINVETAKMERTADEISTTNIDAIEKNCRALIKKLLILRKNSMMIDGNQYEGETMNGLPHGQGVMIYKEGTTGKVQYKGTWVNGECHGQGTMVYIDRSVYIGNFSHNLRDGSGIYETSDYTYDGEWRNDAFNGFGRKIYRDKNAFIKHFAGEFVDGIIHGRGTTVYYNGDKEEATYIKGKRNGLASYYFLKGGYEKGYYSNDMREGKWEKFYNGQHFTLTYKKGMIKKEKKHKE